MRWTLPLLTLLAARAEWVAWPAGEAVPSGWAQRVDAASGSVYVDVNATMLAHLEAMNERWRTSVDSATRAEDTTATLTRREAILSALDRLPDDAFDGADLAALGDEELDVLWTARQEELREFSERLTDTAKTLAGRVDVLADAGADDDALLFALRELEYELGEMDAARDFHDALGGWTPLVALLDGGRNDEVRAAAALAIGTAVKNEDRFQTWVLEDGCLEKLLAALAAPGARDLHKAVLYALGSGLRNNGRVQRAFGRTGLGAVLEAARAALDGAPSKDRRANAVAEKAATLLGDLAAEGQRLPAEACDVAEAVLARAPRTRAAERPLRAALAAAPTCGARWRADKAAFGGGLDELAAALRTGGLDADFADELVGIAGDLATAVESAPEGGGAAPPLEVEPELIPRALLDRLIAAAAPDREL